MVGRKSLTVTSHRYIPEHDVFSDKPYISHYSQFEVEVANLAVEITYRKEKDDLHTLFNDKSYVYCELSKRQFLKLFRFLATEKPDEKEQSASIDVALENGILRTRHYTSGRINHEKDNTKRLDSLHIEANWNTIIIETFAEANPILPYYEVEYNSNPQDRNNLSKLHSFAEELVADVEEGSTIQLDPLPNGLREKLESTTWGHEVLHHIDDGDQCIKNNLPHPALNCYIHAIEWAVISYLQNEAEIDIIGQEQNGNYNSYHDLMTLLTNNADIDQKTESKLTTYNSAERRWVAHHKSGTTTLDDVTAVRHRLYILVEQLFSDDTSR